MTQPSFFLVGAPKCGTTALCKYLAQHPEVYISSPKELNYFDTDFNTKQHASSLAQYLNYFSEGSDKLCGEGSTSYLYSKAAAKNIADVNPNAKIIIMLRHPVTVMRSFHSQLLFNGSSETVQDFSEALALESERKLGRNIPKRCNVPEMLLYREVVKFSEHVKRYLDVFGKEQVKIILFKDFRQETASIYSETLKFIGADPSFETDFTRVNSNKKARSPLLQSLIKYPPASVLEVGKYLLPMPQSWRRGALEKVKDSLKKANTQTVSRPPIDAALKERLTVELFSDVQALEKLIDRDLSDWYPSSVFSEEQRAA